MAERDSCLATGRLGFKRLKFRELVGRGVVEIQSGQVARFEFVYVGDRGDRGMHLHAPGFCDHTGELTAALQHELSELERCGQCENRAEKLGSPIEPARVTATCPKCFMIGPCECEN